MAISGQPLYLSRSCHTFQRRPLRLRSLIFHPELHVVYHQPQATNQQHG
jgi:hypothetical protein